VRAQERCLDLVDQVTIRDDHGRLAGLRVVGGPQAAEDHRVERAGVVDR
jgi:hypothetical protein